MLSVRNVSPLSSIPVSDKLSEIVSSALLSMELSVHSAELSVSDAASDHSGLVPEIAAVVIESEKIFLHH